MKNGKIVVCEVVDVGDDFVTVSIRNKIYKCDQKQISDYPIKVSTYFSIGKKYRFVLLDDNTLSYKAARPKLIRYKKAPVPTINGSRNLNKYLIHLLKEM